MLFISHPVSDSNADDPRYAKGWLDVVFILYHIIVFSFIRQFFILVLVFPIARRLGIRRQHKLDRFGEQAYAMAYYGTMGFWGLVNIVKPRRFITLTMWLSISCRLFLRGSIVRSTTGRVRFRVTKQCVFGSMAFITQATHIGT